MLHAPKVEFAPCQYLARVGGGDKILWKRVAAAYLAKEGVARAEGVKAFEADGYFAHLLIETKDLIEKEGVTKGYHVLEGKLLDT